MFLVDTNIFLEILLKRAKRKKRKKFLNDHIGRLHISDFSLHSLGVILLRFRKQSTSQKFIDDSMPNPKLLTLPIEK